MTDEVRPFRYQDGVLYVLDQRLLPGEETWIECSDYRQVADAIRTLAVRGAPAIGLSAAFAVVLAARSFVQDGVAGAVLHERLMTAIDELAATRPTAVNLFWALRHMRRCLDSSAECPGPEIAELLLVEAERLSAEDATANRAMGSYGAEVIPDGSSILTHCNAGALVSSEFGTALGVIRTAHEDGKRLHVWVDETRPLLQGARLTAWELQRLGVPCTLITDNMAAHVMSRGQIDLVLTGADRIAANGDTANKIGTYGIAVLAHAHGLPFYVAAPTTTIDPDLTDGSEIVIEERRPDEVTAIRGVDIAPKGMRAANPAFDVTPNRLIAGIITEQGVARPPFTEDLRRFVSSSRARAERSVTGV
jgi:methylthioribose-1-phosphate isomerase